MTTFNDYSDYKAAREAGRKDIRFVSLKTEDTIGETEAFQSYYYGDNWDATAIK